MAGQAPVRPPQAEPPAAPEPPPDPDRDGRAPSTAMGRFADWWASLPRPVAVLLTIAGFLIVINLFTNPHRIWFHWPVAGLIFVCILRMVSRRNPRWDRRRERRADRE
jgi:adenylate cyclase